MVTTRRRQIGLLALLLGAALLVWLWRLRSPETNSSGPGDKTSRVADGAALDDVMPIGLERLASADSGKQEGKDADIDMLAEDAGGVATATRPAATPQIAATPAPIVPPTPAEPTPAPMNLRFIGAVQVRSGVWVASLLTDRKDLVLGKEGDVVANRYRIVKIGLQSIELLETASGRQQQLRFGGS